MPKWLRLLVISGLCGQLWISPASAQQAVGLEELERHALTAAPAARRAQAAMAQREALDVAANQRWTENPSAQLLVGPRLAPDGTGVDIQLAFSQTLPTWGMLDARRGAVQAGEALLKAEREVAARAVRAEVRAAWAHTMLARRRTTLATALLAQSRRIVDALTKQLAAGESSQLDLRLAQADAAQAAAALEVARADEINALSALAAVAGWPADAQLIVTDEVPAPEPVPALDALRPHGQSVVRANAALQAARAEQRVWERKASQPLAVGLQLQREGSVSGAEWVIFGGLSWSPPLLQREQVGRAQAQAHAQAAQVELELAERAMRIDIKRAHAVADATYKRWSTLHGALKPQFEEDLKRVERAWELGELRLLEALQARERLLALETQTIEAWGAHMEARAALDALLDMNEVP